MSGSMGLMVLWVPYGSVWFFESMWVCVVMWVHMGPYSSVGVCMVLCGACGSTWVRTVLWVHVGPYGSVWFCRQTFERLQFF